MNEQYNSPEEKKQIQQKIKDEKKYVITHDDFAFYDSNGIKTEDTDGNSGTIFYDTPPLTPPPDEEKIEYGSLVKKVIDEKIKNGELKRYLHLDLIYRGS